MERKPKGSSLCRLRWSTGFYVFDPLVDAIPLVGKHNLHRGFYRMPVTTDAIHIPIVCMHHLPASTQRTTNHLHPPMPIDVIKIQIF